MYKNCQCKQKYCSCNTNKYEDSCDDIVVVNNCMMNDSSCACGYDDGFNMFPEMPMLAQSYVPIQMLDKTFKPCVGLKMGTIYPELVSPYMPNQSIEEINYIRANNEMKGGCNQCMNA